MPVKISRKHSTSRTTSAPRGRGHIYSERWNLAHLAEDPVQRFEALVGEIESRWRDLNLRAASSVQLCRLQSSTRC